MAKKLAVLSNPEPKCFYAPRLKDLAAKREKLREEIIAINSEIAEERSKCREELSRIGGEETDIHLTKREKEVLTAVWGLLTNKEIAAKLSITERTVKYHVSSLLEKYNVLHRSEL